MFVSLQEWEWKAHLDLMTCLFWTLSELHSVAFEAQIKCAHVQFLSLSLCWMHFTLQLSYSVRYSSAFGSNKSFCCCGGEKEWRTLGPVWGCHYVLCAIYFTLLYNCYRFYLVPVCSSIFCFVKHFELHYWTCLDKKSYSLLLMIYFGQLLYFIMNHFSQTGLKTIVSYEISIYCHLDVHVCLNLFGPNRDV